MVLPELPVMSSHLKKKESSSVENFSKVPLSFVMLRVTILILLGVWHPEILVE